MRVRKMSVSNGRSCGISRYPNFSITGNIKGMKKIYGKNALLVKCGGYIYDVPLEIYINAY